MTVTASGAGLAAAAAAFLLALRLHPRRRPPTRRIRTSPGAPEAPGPRAGTGNERSPWHRLAGRRANVVAVLAAVATAAVAPPAVPVVVAVAVIAPVAAESRRARRRARQLLADLPEVSELLALAVDAGLTVREAVSLAAGHLAGPLSAELRAVEREVHVGRRLAEALESLGDRAGDDTRPLAAVLADCERSGAPAGPALRRLAGDARERRRRDAEEAARRLPVKLLFPLVGCVLPAFALLTVVPVVAGALRALRP